MSYYRTPEHRRLRAELIRKWKPWEKSTGPKSDTGKAVSSRNAYRGGVREILRAMSRLLAEQRRQVQQVHSERRPRSH